MPYLRFTKAIISKDKSISMRNKLFMHTVQHDSILGYLKFVSKTDDYQAYGALIPAEMTSLKIRNSPAYKTFLAYATGAIPSKKARKFKKPASSSKKKTLVAVEEPVKKSAKKPATRIQSAGVQIGDTHGVSVSKKKAPTKAKRSKGVKLMSEAPLLEEAQLEKAIKRSKQETNIHHACGSSEGAGFRTRGAKKKAPTKAERSKGIELLFEDASLEEAQLKKAIKRNKQETNIHQAGGSSEGADLESEVPDEPKDSDDGDDDDQQSDDESTESDDDKSDDLNKTDDEEEDEFVHTPDDYVPTNDENVDDEEYDRINKEVYDDVNVELKDTELADEEKGDEEMSHAERVDVKHEEVSQAVTGDQVNDDAQAIVTAALATKKTKVPLQSSSISSDYATKFLNFDNIPPCETKLISMMDIKVQHEDPSIQTIPLLTVPVTVILESLTAPAITIPPPISPFIPLPQQSTPIPTPTTIEATISTTYAPYSSTLTAFHQRLFDLEYEVKTLRNVDHCSAIRATIKSEVSTVVKEYLGTNMDDTVHKQESQYSIKSSDKAALKEFDQKRALFKTMTASKTFNKHHKHKALYHALIESILADEDAMDKGVADIQKKRKLDDGDRDEDPPARPDQWLRRRKAGKDTKQSKKAKSTGTSKGTTKSQLKSIGKSTQAKETADPKDWFKKPKRPPTPDPEWNIDFSAFVMNRLQISDLTQDILTKAAKCDLPGIEDMVPNLWSHIKVAYDKHALLVTNVKVNVWYGYGHLEEIEVRRSDKQLLFNLKGEDIMHLFVALRMFTRRIIIQKRVEDLQLGVENYQKKLNISKPRTREEDLSRRAPYTTLLDPGSIYENQAENNDD
ncbi:hypothetical protein Tco_0577632 [Tanacetum coccineum]